LGKSRGNAVDFKVEQGEVLALIGSNGAGKTTLVNLVSGLMAGHRANHLRGGTSPAVVL
jgi:ABC-type multidrug transport system ATPase subunit